MTFILYEYGKAQKNEMLAPIVIFTYNRVDHTKNLIDSLKKNPLSSNSEVFIFSDGYKGKKDRDSVLQVRHYLRDLENNNPFKQIHVIYSCKNKGLANSIILGVTKVIEQYGKVIVLEDDLIIAPGFLKYMNEGLDYYEADQRIWSLSGFTSDIDILKKYSKDVYFSCRARSWSWATWKDRWETIDWEVKSYKRFRWNFRKRKEFNYGGNDMASMLDRQQAGMINSWAIRWCYNQFEQHKYTVQPRQSLIRNEGQDGSGTNCKTLREVNRELWNESIAFIPFDYDESVDKELRKRKKLSRFKLVCSYVICLVLGTRHKHM